jgi:hypothetical protein
MAYCVEADGTGDVILGLPAVVNAGDTCSGNAYVLDANEFDQLMRLGNLSDENSFQCSGSVTILNPNTVQCSETWVEVLPNVFDPATLDPVLIAGAVGVGAFVLLPLWAALIGIKMLLQSIKH